MFQALSLCSNSSWRRFSMQNACYTDGMRTAALIKSVSYLLMLLTLSENKYTTVYFGKPEQKKTTSEDWEHDSVLCCSFGYLCFSQWVGGGGGVTHQVSSFHICYFLEFGIIYSQHEHLCAQLHMLKNVSILLVLLS